MQHISSKLHSFIHSFIHSSKEAKLERGAQGFSCSVQLCVHLMSGSGSHSTTTTNSDVRFGGGGKVAVKQSAARRFCRRARRL